MQELTINQKLEVEIHSGTYEGKYLSKVADIIEAGIVITGLYREGAPLPVRLQQRITIYFTTDRAAYKFNSKILKRANKPIPILLIEKADSVTRIQRRDHFRLEVSGLVKLYQEDEKSDYKEEFAEARLIDISGGGIQIQLEKNIKMSSILYAQLKNILDDESVIKALVVRKQKENQKLYNYGLEFINIEEDLREEIIQWIFAYQRKKRQKGLR